ncbi:hypothetical protein [Nocardioides halotolerans]|uniref:hypothetical protein n=1 Tax=Nocardioides halotolerans TaxID=433660 RepID=UPI00048A5386|nr:hypothetical protein [Nocardioides halotolerans]
MTEVPSDDEEHWQLPPFSDIRSLGVFEQHPRTGTTYRAFLVFVYGGRAAVARLPLVIPTKHVDIWQRLDDTIRKVLDLLSQLDLEQRVRFHQEIDETVDLYFRLHNLRSGDDAVEESDHVDGIRAGPSQPRSKAKSGRPEKLIATAHAASSEPEVVRRTDDQS